MDDKKRIPAIRFKGFTDSWEQRKVGDYYEFKNGLNKGKEYFGEGTPIVNFTDVFHNRGISPKMLSGRVRLEPFEIKNFEVGKGDIFFTRTSETIEEIGYPSVMLGEPKNTVFSGFVLRGRCFLNVDPLNDLFKKYLFFTDTFRTEMVRKSSMTTRALTSGTAIRNMKFLHPSSKEEQHRIGEFLTNLDNLITLHQRKLESLKKMKKALLEKMFPRDGENMPSIRFKGFTDSWEQRKLGDVVQTRRGLTYSPGDIAENGIRVLRSSNINEDTFEYGTDDVFVNPSAVNIEPVKQNDILITSANGSSKLVGKHALIKEIPDNSAVHGGFMLLGRAQNYEFINASMSSHWYTKFISVFVSGGNGAIGNLSKKDLDEQVFQVPGNSEQVKVGLFFNNLDNLITLHQRKLEKLKNIKKAMLEKMFV